MPDSRKMLISTTSAQVQLEIALESLSHALAHLRMVEIVPPRLMEHISRAKAEALIAITQVSALAKRIP